MNLSTSNYATFAGREIHWMDWGPKDGPVIVAWHGLARTGRDMDELAVHFAGKGFRVLCPDTIGRGLSQWSPLPDDEYQLSFYARIAADFCDALALDRVHWVGTSMGGAIGMVCASGLFEPRMKQRIVSLVLNDTAPQVADAAIARIRGYAGSPPAFHTVAELENFFRTVYKPYGWLSDAQWRRLTETSTRRLPDGKITPHYDPLMVRQFSAHDNDYLIWPHYDAIEVPVLSLRGVDSDLVLPAVIDEMRGRGPGAAGALQTIEVAGCGHAPALNVSAHLEPIEAFIRAAGV
ncbi:alpha/beta fold hydrolase [Variovorax sp. PAMC 28711]|uniref:alpha/beta fold hydrolase n=1 Tax=Variovorax sp. PAMC 28711 TaxID=1795631 RepID=UPI00078D4502|nr:alpha/beta hydrolase [Variovorax sp. PAMC 28711]AMM26094.1 hydrolase [Variovorax sp. PAMC 28711]